MSNDNPSAPTVLVSAKSLRPNEGGAVGRLEEAGLNLRFAICEPTTPAADLLKHLAGCQISVSGAESYSEEIFAASPQLRHIARFGVGYDGVDLQAATAHGVAVTITPGTLENAVADHAFALMLALAHNIINRDAIVRRGQWESQRAHDVGSKTIGIVGLGRIGRAVALRAAGFQMKILACEQKPDAEFVQSLDITLVSLEQLLRESDFVTLHLPVMPETRKIISAEMLACMKQTAYLINTARGQLIDEDALFKALKGGQIAGAGLDVFEQEPPQNLPFTKLDNVVLTHHCSSATWGAWEAMGAAVARDVLKILRREKPDTLLNPKVWPDFQKRG